MKPRSVNSSQLIDWWIQGGFRDAEGTRGLMPEPASHLEQMGVPEHLVLLMERLPQQELDQGLNSVPFYSLCRGLFLPLLSLDAARWSWLLNSSAESPIPLRPDQRAALATEFLSKPLGLTIEEKLACLFCDPYLGKAPRMRQDMLLRVLMGSHLAGRNQLLLRLAEVRDVAVAFAESRSEVRGQPPLTAAEVLRTVRLSREEPTGRKLRVLRSLLQRCGKLEALILAKLLLGRHGAGLGVPAPVVLQSLGACYRIAVEELQRAVSVTDIFRVAQALHAGGADGVRSLRLQPLSPVRPALAGGTTDQLPSYPVWVERKYDGIRCLLHKATDARGAVACAAFTRNGNDWLEMVPGLETAVRSLPAASLILDCELYGVAPTLDGPRSATVYEVMDALHGEPGRLTLKLAAFDVLYLNGQEQTARPLWQRQQVVSNLCAAAGGLSLPVRISMAEGQVAHSSADVNRLYHHFRGQGYEGVITKMLDAPYLLGGRDPNWRKRKPEETLDLTLLGATYAASEQHQGAFGSYVLGAADGSGGFQDIGDVDGVARDSDTKIQELILRLGLATGRSMQRKLSEGSRIGMELRPGIVVTVAYQDIAQDADGSLQLRHPRIKWIRSDKLPEDSDTLQQIVERRRLQYLQ